MGGFASDNNAGIHPDIMKAIAEANSGHCIGYGDDTYTESTLQKMKEVFGPQSDTFFVLTGTAANVLGIRAFLKPYQSVLCASSSHLNVDECGAPENIAGCKLMEIPSENGKLFPESLKPFLEVVGNEHHAQPGAVSITQSTELGTVYTVEEIAALSAFAHNHNMILHMDGARISNAAAHLGIRFRDITFEAGVDLLSFGGTKNGMMIGEAVIIFNQGWAENFKYIRKQGMQLLSKMRFISAQFAAFFNGDLWLKNAKHANYMAKLLSDGIRDIPGCRITQKVEANAVFVKLPSHSIDELKKRYFFYTWDTGNHIIRLMTSFDTTENDVTGLLHALKESTGMRDG